MTRWRYALPLALIAAVAGAHSAYYWAPTLDDRPWWAYVGVHGLVAVALLMLLPAASRWPLAPLGAAACWWGIVESAQAMGCAWLTWGTESSEDLCVQRFGHKFYVLGLSLAVAFYVAQRLAPTVERMLPVWRQRWLEPMAQRMYRRWWKGRGHG